MSLRRAIASIVASACLLAAGLSVDVAPAVAVPTTTAVFNNPLGTAAEKAAIQTRLVELIDGAPAGSRIRMAMFYATDATVPNALIAAKNRGVNVQVIFNDNDSAKAPYAALVTALGTNLSAASWILFCPAGRGCIGNRVLSTVESINHNKFFLFSSTQGASNVVVQSTANLHTGRDGLGGWNAALVLVGNTAIYNAYSGYFDDLRARVANNNYYDTGRPAVTSGNAKIHFYPRQESNGQPYNDPNEDTIMTVLDNVACFGNSVVGTQDGTHRTIIRVNQAIFSRTYLASKLWALDNAGCYVEVVERYDPGSGSEVTAMKNLLAATNSAYGGPVVKYYCVGDSVWTHSKYLQVEGNYYGGADRTITWVGSHNFSYNSLRQSDETLLQLEDTTVFNAFRTNFRTVRDAAGIRSVANGRTATCP
ncbi:phospholipase D-like domain-containing protein [Micromonospora sp. DR5-3]|uniref:phospholipase D-like domain-containing protein n=1 Tax=unclassified Micromonospora TaxID=2617518 RepID=UPI00165250AB|nr:MULTISPECIES: phospholipase D-like domain-containing protein [unclassified Micromonospora]MCW3814050.1 phospholipase D-like domain-containing protein [Micromonospora sp. DR5-3]